MCRCSTETHRAENSRHEGGVIFFKCGVGVFAHFVKLGDEEQAEDVGFCFFQCRILLLKRVTHRAAAVEGVLDAKAVRHLVEHHVGEESVEFDVFTRVFRDQNVGNRYDDFVEFRLHGIFELQFACAFLQLHSLVVRQVDGDGFRSHVAVAAVVNHVVCRKVGIAAGFFLFIFCLDRQFCLKLRQ